MDIAKSRSSSVDIPKSPLFNNGSSRVQDALLAQSSEDLRREEATESKQTEDSSMDVEFDEEQQSQGVMDDVNLSTEPNAMNGDEVVSPRTNDALRKEQTEEHIMDHLTEDDLPVDRSLSESIPGERIKEGSPVVHSSPPRRIPIDIPLPPSIHPAILIPAPIETTEDTSYNLDIDTKLVPELQSSPPSNDYSSHFKPEYAMPPLSILPPDFNRKVKSTRRKRDKDKEGKRDKEDTLPLGLNRWSATLKVNPVWTKVSQASKCLSTREWGVSTT